MNKNKTVHVEYCLCSRQDRGLEGDCQLGLVLMIEVASGQRDADQKLNFMKILLFVLFSGQINKCRSVLLRASNLLQLCSRL